MRCECCCFSLPKIFALVCTVNLPSFIGKLLSWMFNPVIQMQFLKSYCEVNLLA